MAPDNDAGRTQLPDEPLGGAGGVTRPPGPGDPPPSDGDERPGDRIGPYRLLSILGEGGFGTVWLAERRDPFEQRVALKIIKPGMDSRAVEDLGDAGMVHDGEGLPLLLEACDDGA